MKNGPKIISWMVLSVVTTVTAVAYFCPMAALGSSTAMNTAPSLYQSLGSVGAGMEGQTSCMSSHLVATGNFLSDLPRIINFLLVFVLLAVFGRALFRNLLTTILQPLFSRLRYLCFNYCTSIKLLIEEKLLKYLGFLGNYTIISFS